MVLKLTNGPDLKISLDLGEGSYLVFGNSDWEGSGWESSGTETESWGSKRVSTVSDGSNSWGSGVSSSWDSGDGGSWGSGDGGGWGSGDGWGSSVTDGGSWGSDGSYGNSWGSYGVSNLMGLGVGAGLVDWLLVGDFSGNWSDDWFSSENWLLGKDWAGREGLGDDWSWLDGSDGSWLVNMGVFSNWDGLVSNLWGNFSESFSGLYGVGKVSSQSVVGDGSGIMSWGTDKGLSSYEWGSYERGTSKSYWSYAGIGGGNKGSDNSDKGVHFG